jgi:hypothetical protein
MYERAWRRGRRKRKGRKRKRKGRKRKRKGRRRKRKGKRRRRESRGEKTFCVYLHVFRYVLEVHVQDHVNTTAGSDETDAPKWNEQFNLYVIVWIGLWYANQLLAALWMGRELKHTLKYSRKVVCTLYL